MSELAAAIERSNAAWTAYTKASQEAYNAGAEVARLQLIAYCEEFGFTGMDFEMQYENDDEGGMFETCSVTLHGGPADDESADALDYLEYEHYLGEQGIDALSMLCGVEHGQDGTITVEEARERSF